MAAKTAKQAAAQERFRAAAKQAKREGKKGKSYARRVGELLRGRASPGAGRKTAPSSHGGSSMASAKSKPKPRVAVYAGAAGSLIAAAGAGLNKAGLQNVTTSSKGTRLSGAAANLSKITGDAGTALAVAAPAVIGVVASVAADKLGINRVIAKARMPFRV